WLNGRMGAANVSDLLAAVFARGGVGEGALDLSGAVGTVGGYVLHRPMRLAAAAAPLATAYAFDLAERGGLVAAAARDGAPVLALGDDALALPDAEAADLQPT